MDLHLEISPFRGPADLRFVSGDVCPVHRETTAAACGGTIWLVDEGSWSASATDHGLLDELIIQVASVTLGRGKPLLPRRITTPPLRLISAVAQGEAFVELRSAVPRPA